jgi:FtsZ-binding cell division protein ZapB
MKNQLLELKYSLKELTQNLIDRIDLICTELETEEKTERLAYWLQDLSALTESMMVLTKNNMVDFDVDLFNEKMEALLDKIEETDFLFVSDLLQYEIKPLLSYWDGQITHG